LRPVFLIASACLAAAILVGGLAHATPPVGAANAPASIDTRALTLAAGVVPETAYEAH
jgi:hypothetical protein